MYVAKSVTSAVHIGPLSKTSPSHFAKIGAAFLAAGGQELAELLRGSSSWIIPLIFHGNFPLFSQGWWSKVISLGWGETTKLYSNSLEVSMFQEVGFGIWEGIMSEEWARHSMKILCQLSQSVQRGVLHSRALFLRQADLRIFYHGQHGKEFLGAAWLRKWAIQWLICHDLAAMLGWLHGLLLCSN